MESTEVVLHIESQTTTHPEMAFRMLDYGIRLYKRYPNKKIHQTVIYLKCTNSPLAFETSYVRERTIHGFNVISLWEQPLEIFEQYVGLMPFVALGKGNPTENLRAVAKLIDNISDEKVKSDVLAETYIISGLALDVETIERILRRENMQESVTFQKIRLEGEEIGEARGEAKGIAETKIATALNMLHCNMSIDLIAQFTGLSVEEIERLR